MVGQVGKPLSNITSDPNPGYQTASLKNWAGLKSALSVRNEEGCPLGADALESAVAA